MPTQPNPERAAKRFEREQAKARVVRAYKGGHNWHEVARSNDVHYSTARRAVLAADKETKEHGGLRASNVKLTVEAMCKLEEYIEDDCRRTLADLRDLLLSDLGISVGKSTIHRALQGMLYSVKRVRIEKATMNSATNKAKRKAFVRGDYDTYTEHRLAIMKETVEASKGVITRRLVWKFERHCLRHYFAAEREEDMKLGA